VLLEGERRPALAAEGAYDLHRIGQRVGVLAQLVDAEAAEGG